MFCVYLRSFSSATSDHIASAGTTDLFCIMTHLQSEPGHSSIELLFRISLPKTQNCSDVYTCWSRLRGRLWVGSLTNSFGIQVWFFLSLRFEFQYTSEVKKILPWKRWTLSWEFFFYFVFVRYTVKNQIIKKKKILYFSNTWKYQYNHRFKGLIGKYHEIEFQLMDEKVTFKH